MIDVYTQGIIEIHFKAENDGSIEISPLAEIILKHLFPNIIKDIEPDEKTGKIKYSHWSELDNYLLWDYFGELLKLFIGERFKIEEKDDADLILDKLDNNIDCLEYMLYNSRFKDISRDMINRLINMKDDIDYIEWFEILIDDPDSSIDNMTYHTVNCVSDFCGSVGYTGKHISEQNHTYELIRNCATLDQFLEDDESDMVSNALIKDISCSLNMIRNKDTKLKIKQMLINKIKEI